MGQSRTYKCNQCGYSVLTSGGLDYGFVAVTNTYICKSCKEVVDVTIGKHGKVFKKSEIAAKAKDDFFDMSYYVCPQCESGKHLIKWSKTKRPCPKCDEGKMDVDPKGDMIMWD